VHEPTIGGPYIDCWLALGCPGLLPAAGEWCLLCKLRNTEDACHNARCCLARPAQTMLAGSEEPCCPARNLAGRGWLTCIWRWPGKVTATKTLRPHHGTLRIHHSTEVTAHFSPHLLGPEGPGRQQPRQSGPPSAALKSACPLLLAKADAPVANRATGDGSSAHHRHVRRLQATVAQHDSPEAMGQMLFLLRLCYGRLSDSQMYCSPKAYSVKCGRWAASLLHALPLPILRKGLKRAGLEGEGFCVLQALHMPCKLQRRLQVGVLVVFAIYIAGEICPAA
jgi:hypothetical protein